MTGRRAGQAARTNTVMHHIAEEWDDVAACSPDMLLVNVVDADDVPYGHRCQRSGCRPLWP